MGNKQLLDYGYNTNPTRVELELTERCNLACRFCYNSQKPIDSSISNLIIQRLADEGVPEIVLTGGEPLVHPNFVSILERCEKLFSKVMVQTNGTLIDDSVANAFVASGVYEVNISIHGNSKKHDWLTCTDSSYVAAIEALTRLIKKGVRVSSNFVMTKANITALPENIINLYDIGVRCMTLTRFTPTGIGAGKSDLTLSREEIIYAVTLADDMSRKLSGLNVLLANSMPRCALPHSLAKYSECCHFGVSRFYVDIVGNVLMCGMSRTKIGNILDTSFAEIKRHSNIFVNHLLGLDVPETCMKCRDFNHCRGGCRAAALACSGDLHGEDPYMIEEATLE